MNTNELTLKNNSQVVQLPDGTFKTKKTYQEYIGVLPNNDLERVELFNLMNGSGIEMTPFKSHMNKTITIANAWTFPYPKTDPQTGEQLQGVRIVLKDVKGVFYVTSSKTVYKSLENLLTVFPIHSNEITIKVVETSSNETTRKLIDIQLVKTKEK